MHRRLANQAEVSKLAGKKINSQNTHKGTLINAGTLIQMLKDLAQWEGKGRRRLNIPGQKR